MHTILVRVMLAVLTCSVAGFAAAQSPNHLTPAERAAGWRLLFDGASLTEWRGLGYDSVPTAHWRVIDGTIVKIPTAKVQRQADGQPAAGGDLMTIDSFRDFELAFEWRVTPGANGGVKYNVSEELSLKHASKHAALGFEYQVLDDASPTTRTRRTRRVVVRISRPTRQSLRPSARNSARIVLLGDHGEHWLNGAKVVESIWERPARFTAQRSKYKAIPGRRSPAGRYPPGPW